MRRTQTDEKWTWAAETHTQRWASSGGPRHGPKLTKCCPTPGPHLEFRMRLSNVAAARGKSSREVSHPNPREAAEGPRETAEDLPGDSRGPSGRQPRTFRETAEDLREAARDSPRTGRGTTRDGRGPAGFSRGPSGRQPRTRGRQPRAYGKQLRIYRETAEGPRETAEEPRETAEDLLGDGRRASGKQPRTHGRQPRTEWRQLGMHREIAQDPRETAEDLPGDTRTDRWKGPHGRPKPAQTTKRSSCLAPRPLSMNILKTRVAPPRTRIATPRARVAPSPTSMATRRTG